MATDSGCLSEIIPGNDTFVLLIYGNSYEFLKTVIKKNSTTKTLQTHLAEVDWNILFHFYKDRQVQRI